MVLHTIQTYVCICLLRSSSPWHKPNWYRTDGSIGVVFGNVLWFIMFIISSSKIVCFHNSPYISLQEIFKVFSEMWVCSHCYCLSIFCTTNSPVLASESWQKFEISWEKHYFFMNSLNKRIFAARNTLVCPFRIFLPDWFLVVDLKSQDKAESCGNCGAPLEFLLLVQGVRKILPD